MKNNYWIKQGSDFNKFYGNIKITNPKNFVSSFLNSRTKILMSFLSNENLGKVLDVGCGSAVHMRAVINQCKYISGVDISSKMIDLAKKNMKEENKSKWELRVANAEKLPYKINYFDTVISMGLLDYVEDPSSVLRECYRVLKKDGLIIFSLPKSPSLFSPLRSTFGNIIKRVIFNLPPIRNSYTLNELNKLLYKTGFISLKTVSVWSTMWIVKAGKRKK